MGDRKSYAASVELGAPMVGGTASWWTPAPPGFQAGNVVLGYNATDLPPGPNWAPILMNRLTVRGFIVSDHAHRLAAFLTDCARWVHEGELKYREDVVEGLDHAPRAFIGRCAVRTSASRW
jgi:NADPH-dependent curcumin reductase CurA